MNIDPDTSALVLIGYQRDYFSPDGILHGVVEESQRVSGTLANTLAFIEAYKDTSMLMVNTPIVFSELYEELENPIGILKTIRDVQAFKQGASGAEVIEEITSLGDRILTLPGKKSFNAFSNTQLGETLRERGIKTLIFAGCVTSICVHATALHAFDSGYNVILLSDCTSSRTPLEQDFFCENVFPLFSEVKTSRELKSAICS